MAVMAIERTTASSKESENAGCSFFASPEVEPLAGGVWGGSRRPAIADVLAVAKPRGILLCLGRHAEHRALFRSGSGGSLVEL